MNEEYISTQIAVYKNSKTLLEFHDKLKVASMYSYAHIHADGEDNGDGRRKHSLIGILMKDYSGGTGDNEKGYAQVTKVRFIRALKDSKGNARKIPWYVEVENGKGIPLKNATGGTYMKSGSFISTGKVYANLTDLDLFKLLSRVSSYIDAWEHSIAPSLITMAKKAMENRQAQQNAA